MAEKEPQQFNINSEDAIAEFARKRREKKNKKGKNKAISIGTAGSEGEYGDAISDFARSRREALRKQSTEGFSFLTNGNIGGAVGLALAGLLLVKSQDWAETWKRYGRNNFPLTKGGWATLRKELSKARAGIGGIGKK